MKHVLRPGFARSSDRDDRALVTCEVAVSADDPAKDIIDYFASVKLAHVLVFASPEADFPSLMRSLSESFDCPVVGCTSAGEIGHDGYSEDHIVAVGLPREQFAARSVLIDDLAGTDFSTLVDQLIQERTSLTLANQGKKNGFSFLMVDGMSRREDELVNAIGPSVANFTLFGGSAGDGLRFQRSFVSVGGAVHENAAVLTFVVTDCETKVFSINHMTPTDRRMVVTEANPGKRIVKGINDEPAAAEYARLVGKDPCQLDAMVFAAHPVMVRIGDDYHVRAIQRVDEDGDLIFFSAIDEGMVLTVAEPRDMASHLDEAIGSIVNGHDAPSILACDCVLRRVEAQKSQTRHKVSEVLKAHGVVGFSTYGEQIGPLHLNHTMTGVALFPPQGKDA